MSQRSLRVLVADDEAIARRRVVRLLAAFPHVTVVAECTNGSEVLAHLAASQPLPDILLLDIRMPELSGLEACALLPEDAPYIIFVTAHSEHALEAFEVGAEDYLLKPIEAASLERALRRASARLAPPASSATEPLPRIPVQTARGIVLVDPAQLSSALLDGELTTLHTSRGTILSDLSLKQLLDLLPDARFWRVHRKALINLDRVERLESLDSGGYSAHMADGSTVPVSRQAGRRLRRTLGTRGPAKR